MPSNYRIFVATAAELLGLFDCNFFLWEQLVAFRLVKDSSVIFSQAVEVIEEESGVQDSRLESQRTEAFLSLARFSDAQYQSIDKYMNSSEFENKQALLEKAKEEVDLMKERKVTSNRSAPWKKFFILHT